MREQKTEEVSRPRDIAILAGLSSPRLDDNADSETMAELEALVETAGGGDQGAGGNPGGHHGYF